MGGANLSMIHLILHLRELGVNSTVMIPKHGEIEDVLQNNNIPYIVCKYASMRIADRGKIINFAEGAIRAILNTYTAFSLSLTLKGKIDIIHCNSSLVFVGTNLKKFMHKPLIWHLREFGEGDYDLAFPFGINHARRNYNKADVLVAISDSIRDYYSNKICPQANIKTIYNGINPKGFITAKHNNSKIRICMLGGLSASKNQEELIKALAFIRDLNFDADIIGDGTEDTKEYLNSLINQENLQDKVRLLGKFDNPKSILNRYDIGIVASKNEAFGRVIIEYMMSSLCVIASDTGACVELLDDGRTGLLYHLGSEQDLAAKIRYLLENQGILKKIASSGRHEALAKFTSERNAIEIHKLYQRYI